MRRKAIAYFLGLVCLVVVAGLFYMGRTQRAGSVGAGGQVRGAVDGTGLASTRQHPVRHLSVAASGAAGGGGVVLPSAVADRYAEAVVLAEDVSPVDAVGLFTRVRLVEVASKHRYHRVEELLQEQPGGGPRLLQQHGMAADHILVVLPEARALDAAGYFARAGLRVQAATGIPGGYLVGGHEAPSLDTVPALLVAARELREVELAEPNYVYWHAALRPDDPDYAQQWALETINMPEVWAGTPATSAVVVAVFDTGTTLWHPDLYETLWTNAAEVADNDIDDDGNGYADDFYGWNFYSDTNDPTDLHGHGTHVHGTIGAAGNNTIGVSGVGWHLRTVAVPFMGPTGHGFAADAAAGLYYVQSLVARGVPIKVTNHSWGGGAFSAALSNAFVQVSGEVLHVAAAGNTLYGGTDNDEQPFYPASLAISNMIAVANSTDADHLNRDSHYGAESVHLAAPGTSIRSTLLSGGYGQKTGTSMAAPHVAGVLALLCDAFPEKSAAEVRAALLAGVQPVAALEGKVATEGRLDALGAFLAAGPVLDHAPHPNVDADVPAYEIVVQVRPGPAFLGEEGVRLYWDTAADLSSPTTNIMTLLDGVRYTGEIPGRPEGNRVHYWIEAIGLDGKRVVHPAGAPGVVHSFDVTFPVDVHIQGLPGAYGSVTPAYGSHQVPWGNEVIFEAPAHTPLGAGSRWRSIGWDGAGSIPATGRTNRFAAVIHKTSYLAWRWRLQYALEESSDPAGGILYTRWWDFGVTGQTSLAPQALTFAGIPHRFVGWWLDGVRQSGVATTRAINPAVDILMDRVRQAEARYVPVDADEDGDGLPDWWELYYFGDLGQDGDGDTDGDGFAHAREYADRADPTDPASYPEAPGIAVVALPEQLAVPGPWEVRAVVTDRVALGTVLLHWRTPGADVWQMTRMHTAEADAADLYAALIPAGAGPGETYEYRVFAEDVAWNATTSGVYRFAVDYPVLSFGSLDPALVLVAGDQQLVRLAVTNLGTAAWHWQASYGYAEAVDGVQPAGWTSGGTNNQWHVSGEEFVSSPYAWFCGDPDGGTYRHSMDASLYSPQLLLGAGATLRFRHWAEMEYDGSPGYEQYYWDGAVVELSSDGGASFFAIEPEGGYPYRITPNPASPFAGHRPCFGGTTGGWQQAVFDLGAYAGDSVQIRFRFGTDRWLEYRGWFLDDIMVDWAPQWLEADPASGTIEPGTVGWVTWRVDASGLGAGHYRSAWVLTGNAPLQQQMAGRVELEVRPAPPHIRLQELPEEPDVRGFVVRWHSETGRVYSLLHGDNLTAGIWQGVPGYTNLAGTGAEISYTGRLDTTERQFYRIEDRLP